MKSRKLILVVSLVVCGLIALGLYWGGCLKDPRQALIGTTVTTGQLMSWRTDPQELARKTVEQAKSFLFQGVPIDELIQPIQPGREFGVDWKQKTYAPYYITFYSEEVKGQALTLPIIRNFRCSPSFVFWLNPEVLGHHSREELEQINRSLLADEKALNQAKANGAEIARLISVFSDPATLKPAPDSDKSNCVYNDDEICLLKSYAGVVSILLQATRIRILQDETGQNIHGQGPFGNGPNARQLLLEKIDHDILQVNSDWPVAYLEQYFETNRSWLKVKAALSLWGTALFSLLLWLMVYLVCQWLRPDLAKIIRQAMLQARLSVEPGAVAAIQKQLFSQHPWLSYHQPWRRKVLRLLQPLMLLEKLRQESSQLIAQADAVWTVLRTSLATPALGPLAGLLSVAVDSDREMSIRHDALAQLQKALDVLLAKATGGEKVPPAPEPNNHVKRRPPPRSRRDLALESLPPEVEFLAKPGFWRELSPREIELIASAVGFLESIQAEAVAVLLVRRDLKALLRSDSAFISCIKAQDHQGIRQILNLDKLAEELDKLAEE